MVSKTIINISILTIALFLNVTLNYAQDITLHNFINSQTTKSGQNGYMTIMSHANASSSKLDGLTIVYINGIKNEYNEGRNVAADISAMLARRVVLVYSMSINFVSDVKKALDLRMRDYKPAEVMALYNLIIHEISRGNKVRVFAHSRGAAVAYRAATMLTSLDYINDKNSLTKILNNLEFITLGGFSPSSSKWPSGMKVYDLVNQYDLVGKYNDDVPFFDPHFRGIIPVPISIKDHPISNYYKILPAYKEYELKIQWRAGI